MYRESQISVKEKEVGSHIEADKTIKRKSELKSGSIPGSHFCRGEVPFCSYSLFDCSFFELHELIHSSFQQTAVLFNVEHSIIPSFKLKSPSFGNYPSLTPVDLFLVELPMLTP